MKIKEEELKVLKGCLFWVCVFVSLVAGGQESVDWRFDHFTQKDGLSNNQVHCIYQDAQGWMWFGTTYGLNRFDGRSFEVFKHDAADSTTLGANLVRCIFEDSRGQLWVGLENGGLCRFDRDREVFVRNENRWAGVWSVNDITEDQAGNLWLATSRGLMCQRRDEAGKFMAEEFDLELISDHVKKVLVDKHSRVWLGTDQGLYVFDPAGRKLHHLELPGTVYPNDEIWALYADGTDRVWVGTYHSGLYYVAPWELKAVKSGFDPRMERAQTIRAIAEGKDGRFWVGTRAGLFSFEGERSEYHGLGEDDGGGAGINSVLSLLVDAKSDLWVGSRQGISYFVWEKQFIRSYNTTGEAGRSLNNGEVYAFLPDGHRVWIGTEAGGVNCLDRMTGRFTYYTRGNAGLTSNCIKAFMKDGNELWVGTFMGGINVLDMRTGRLLRTYRHDKNRAASLADDRVWALYCDRKGNIWVGTSRGLDCYDRTTGRFVHRLDVVPSYQVNWISEDEDGDLWVGCEDELIIYNSQKEQIKKYFRKTRSMNEVGRGNYYVATVNGLARFDKARGFWRFYTEKDGLISNYTLSVLPGVDSTLWVSTANGLSLFSMQEERFKNFQEKDGLQDNQFNYGAFARTEDGELLFGGINGFDVIVPERVQTNRYVPSVVLTELRVFNRKAEAGDGVLDRNIAFTDEIRLRYDQNMLGFSFVALNYVMAGKNQYRYRLDGLEDQWVDAGNRTTATYANLAPGSYCFRVMGSNNDGVWNEQGAALRVVIAPPFWDTWWFMLLMIAVAALILFAVMRAYIYRETMKNRLVMEKAQARKLHEVDMMKLQFFTNVSHEIRTPLTLIVGPVEKMYRQATDEDCRTQLGMVYQNARKLLKLINQLLDFRKLEAGQYTPDYQSGDLVRFLKEVVLSFEYAAREKGIGLIFSAGTERCIARMDADKLEKVMDNLLSNALKFTERGGMVKVEVQIGEKEYEIRVEDTGIGIAADNLNRIFNRFFQSSPSAEVTGTGIGLAIVRSFTELMGGTADVRSEEGKGTVFTISLPLLREEQGDEEEADGEVPEETVREGRYLLIVDDNEDIRTFIRTHFKGTYRVLEAADGKAGFELAVEQIPDVIIADMLMPVMNGLEMCRKLKKDERTAHIPVVMLTAVNSKETELESLLTGIDDYITKPFDVNILGAKVDNLLNIRNALREKVRSELLMQPAAVVLDSPNERFLRKAVEVVEKYMDDPELDIERFAEEMGVSRMQLYRKFEAFANMTVKEFIRSVRLKRAAQMMEQGSMTVSEVAWAVGFKDMSYFRKCFKDEFGMTPTEKMRK